MKSYGIVKRLNVPERTQPSFLQVSKRVMIGPFVLCQTWFFQRRGRGLQLPFSKWLSLQPPLQVGTSWQRNRSNHRARVRVYPVGNGLVAAVEFFPGGRQ